jgi:hypothetical protein
MLVLAAGRRAVRTPFNFDLEVMLSVVGVARKVLGGTITVLLLLK